MTFGLIRETVFGTRRRARRGPGGRKIKGDDDRGDSSDDDGKERDSDSPDYFRRGEEEGSSDEDGDGSGSGEEDDDCVSEDERVRREVLESEHRERVTERKKWFAGFVPGGYGGRLFGVGGKDGRQGRHGHHHRHHYRAQGGGGSATSPDVEWRENGLGGDGDEPRGRMSREEGGEEDEEGRGGLLSTIFRRRRERVLDEEMGGRGGV